MDLGNFSKNWVIVADCIARVGYNRFSGHAIENALVITIYMYDTLWSMDQREVGAVLVEKTEGRVYTICLGQAGVHVLWVARYKTFPCP